MEESIMPKPKKKLTIVCENKLTEYGNFLFQLISQTKTKNYKLEAGILTEKQYTDSKSTISSENYCVFIGTNNKTRKHRQFIEDKFNKIGMHYGWLGKQAFFYVDSSTVLINNNNYKTFIELSQKYTQSIPEVQKIMNPEDYAGFLTIAITDSITDGVLSGLAAALMDTALIRGKRTKQQWQCLTMVFYQDALDKFLEIEAQS